jgi:hypothetical protein
MPSFLEAMFSGIPFPVQWTSMIRESMHRIAAQLGLPFGLLVLACSTDSPESRQPGASSVFDSSDVPHWRVIGPAVAEIGGREPHRDFLLVTIAGGRILSDGRFLVADRSTGAISIFSGAGDFLRRFGGEGGGPGEFRALGWVGLAEEDTLLAWDIQLGRMTVFDTSGIVLRTYSPDLRDIPFLSAVLVGHLPGGGLVFSVPEPMEDDPPRSPRRVRGSVRYLLLPEGGSEVLALFQGPGTETHRRGGLRIESNLPILFAAASLATTVGEHLVVGSTDSLQLFSVRPDGTVTAHARLPTQARPVAEEHVRLEHRSRVAAQDARWEQIARRMSAPADEWERALSFSRESLQQIPARDTFPAFSDLVGTSVGEVWVAEYPVPGAEVQRWVILGSDLKPQGRITLPTGYRILDSMGDRILSSFKDELGVETVALLRVSRAP